MGEGEGLYQTERESRRIRKEGWEVEKVQAEDELLKDDVARSHYLAGERFSSL